MSLLRGIRKGMHRFGTDIAGLVNTILLTIVYFIGVGLTSIVAKLSGKRFLDTKLDRKSKTYWNNLNIKKRQADDYYRQF
jgi:hypothetical protein